MLRLCQIMQPNGCPRSRTFRMKFYNFDVISSADHIKRFPLRILGILIIREPG